MFKYYAIDRYLIGKSEKWKQTQYCNHQKQQNKLILHKMAHYQLYVNKLILHLTWIYEVAHYIYEYMKYSSFFYKNRQKPTPNHMEN